MPCFYYYVQGALTPLPSSVSHLQTLKSCINVAKTFIIADSLAECDCISYSKQTNMFTVIKHMHCTLLNWIRVIQHVLILTCLASERQWEMGSPCQFNILFNNSFKKKQNKKSTFVDKCNKNTKSRNTFLQKDFNEVRHTKTCQSKSTYKYLQALFVSFN